MNLGPYLNDVLTMSEVLTLRRRLDALDTISGCRDVTTTILVDSDMLRGMRESVRFMVAVALREDRPGVWRRRGAGAWSHVKAIASAQGMSVLFPGEGDSVCGDQVRAAIAESLCDAAIADLSTAEAE